MDMPGREPLELMHEVESVLGIQSFAMNWPIGTGRDFQGVVDRKDGQCLFFTKVATGGAQKAEISKGRLEDVKERLGQGGYDALKQDLELLEMAGNSFSLEDFLAGTVTPVFFASALTNFGIEPFFDAFIDLAPCPQARVVDTNDGNEMRLDPTAPFSGYVFKLQANMDRRHRDSMAFLRICSGRFDRDLVVKHHRLGREIRLSRPHGMVAGERTTLDFAFPGDVIGVINPGLFAIGDTLSLTGGFTFKPLPSFQPEIFAKVSPADVNKRKAFDKGVVQLTSEGAIQLFRPYSDMGYSIFGAVGQLQFEVMQYRLKDEYGVETTLSPLSYQCSAWLIGDLKTFKKPTNAMLVQDRHDRPVVLFSNAWEKQYAMKENPDHQLLDMLI